MRRFYSLLLTAAFLLVGMNAQAKVLVGNDWAALQGAVDAIMAGTETDPEIKLNGPVLLDSDPIWIGTASLDGAYKSITLDLNGQKISATTGTGMFVLTHGELKVINTAANEATVELSNGSSSAQIFSVYGSYRSSRWNANGDANVAGTNTRAANGGWCSHLVIGKNVKVFAKDGCQGAGIAVDALAYGKEFKTTAANKTKLTYGTQLNISPKADKVNAAYGYAFGVRVDVEGVVDIQGISDSKSKSYGVKVNGYCSSPISAYTTNIKTKLDGTNEVAYLKNYNTYNGETGVTHKLDTLDAPFIYIHPNAEIRARQSGDKSTAIYASGYAKWLLDGATCEGKTGVYVSSGEVDIHDAQIVSTAEAYQKPTDSGSANGGGSGIVVNSRDNYAGDIDITISGDTKVQGAEGYGIEEIVNTVNEETKVEHITINGGTIENGDLGAIALNSENKTVVVAGNIQGVIVDNDQPQPLSKYVSNESHMTKVVDEYNNEIYVVSEGATGPTEGNMVSTQAEGASVKWITNTTDAIVDGQHLKLTELEINSNGLVQTLTIQAGATLEVGRVILGKDARIVVEAGGKFIVTGNDGIVAPSTNNITLKHNSETGKYATFIFNPSVTFNRHPNATIEFTTKSWSESSADHQWEWFGVPTYNAIKSIAATCPAFVAVYENNSWSNIGLVSNISASEALRAKMNKPFAAYDLLANRTRTAAAPTVTITGELVGNVNATLKAERKWSPFANSYTAEVDAKEFVNGLSGNIADAIYLAKQNNNGTITWNLKTDDLLEDLKLQPMQAFLLLNNGATEEATINYESMVYDPATPNNAPSRFAAEENTTKVTINVANENGTWDDVDLRENGKIKAYEKYLNDDVNIYVVDGEKNDYVAAEDLENTYVGFSTVNGGNFTISFAKAEGREFDLIDLETGARVAVSEGETYSFSAAANYANDYRFKLVERAKMPTAIENTEVKANVKGIFTLTGQYLGEMNVWNTLPAGVYVVNGVKIVK